MGKVGAEWVGQRKGRVILSRIYLGVDPGLGGGMARIWYAPVRGTPLIRFTATPKDEFSTLEWLRNSARGAMAVIEEQLPQAFPGSAKGSTGKLYGSYMALRMALTAVDIVYVPVRAAVWQRGIGMIPRVNKGPRKESREQWKQRLKRKAEEIFPLLHITLATADALLIAHYCQLANEGGLHA